MLKPWRNLIIMALLAAPLLWFLPAQQAIKETEVWVTWTNLPPRWDIEYAKALGGPTTQWVAFLKKVDATMPMTNFQLQVTAPNEQRFWRLVPR